jgi:adenylate cyclase
MDRVKPSLRSLLVLSSLLVLGTTLLIVGGSAYVAGRAAVAELSDQLLRRDALRMQETAIHLLEAGAHTTDTALAHLNDRLVRGQPPTARDFPEWTEYLGQIARAHPEVTYLSIGLEDTGEYCHVYRRSDGEIELQECVRAKNGIMIRSDYRWRFGQDRALLRRQRTDFDPRIRPFYIAAQRARTRVWTDAYPFVPRDDQPAEFGLTCAAPAYRRDGHLWGVLTADFTLEQLSRLARALHLGESGLSGIVERRTDGSELILAHPDVAIQGRRLGADPRLQELLEALDTATFISGEPRVVRFESGGRMFLGSGLHLNTGGNPNWLLCTLVPEADVLRGVNRSAAVGIAVAVLGGLAGIAISLWLARRISRTLNALAAQADRVGRFDLEGAPVSPPGFAELDTLTGAVERMRTRLRTLERLLPAQPVRQLADDEGATAPPRTVRTVTVGLVQLANFTDFAESVPAETLVDLLNELFDTLSLPLEEWGVIDRYLGDEIMAHWGAPLVDPDQAVNACNAVLRARDALERLQESWRARGHPTLAVRFALATGDAVVGLMGSAQRQNFATIGDPVHLSRRLSALNAFYRTQVLLTEETRRAAGEGFVTRSIDSILLGDTGPFLLSELLGLRADADPVLLQVVDLSEQAFEAFLDRRFADSEALIRRALELRPEDLPLRLRLAECLELQRTPPGPDWNGARHLEA